MSPQPWNVGDPCEVEDLLGKRYPDTIVGIEKNGVLIHTQKRGATFHNLVHRPQPTFALTVEQAKQLRDYAEYYCHFFDGALIDRRIIDALTAFLKEHGQ